MELVYLWIERYKNIENKGFNFSSKFECSYKDSILTITPKTHIENLFDENGKINITAIVGENGSGKSTICNSLINARNGIIKVYKIDDSFYLHSSKVEIKKYPSYFKKIDLKKVEQIKFNYDFFSQEFRNDAISNANAELSFSDKDVFNEIFDSSYENIDVLKYKRLIGRVIHKYGKTISTLSNFKHQNILIKLKIDNYFDIYKRDRLNNSIENTTSFNINIDDKYKNLDYDKKLLLYIIYLINEDKIDDGKPNWLNIFSSFDELISTHSRYLKLTEEPDILFLIKNYDEYCKFLTLIKENHDGNISENFPLPEKLLFSRNFYPLLELDYFDKLGRKYNSLSHGEKQIHSSMLLLYDEITNSNKNNFEIILDEIETSLHPQWQKNIISELIKLCKIFSDKRFHIIISSHSPFILSDLPKENVIFLKDGKQVDMDINPFGANIHTLLSHGFFMDGGLMGEFAKNKIDNIIKLLNSPNKLSDDEIINCENIISIIGEPIIKNQLQKKLDSKRLKKIDKIDELEEEIELIKQRIEILRKNI